jgi:hypothetical protein
MSSPSFRKDMVLEDKARVDFDSDMELVLA